MKKNNLLKILLLVFIGAIFLSWIIPTGEYSNGSFVAGSLTPSGIFDLTFIPLTVFDLALPTIIFVLVVGGFYGVINKTGVYSKMIETFTNKLKGKELKFLIITTICFGLLSSLVGLNFMFFFIIPFVSTILLSLGFSKLTTMISTIGAIFVGMIGSIYGSDISYYLNGYLGYSSDYSYNTSIFPDKIILLVLILFLLVMFIIKKGRAELNNKKSKLEEIPLYEENEKSKKSFIPLLILIIGAFIMILIGSFKWDAVIGMSNEATPFLDFYKKITDVKISGFPIISNMLGTMPAIGYWTMPFASVFILFVTIVISIVYKVRFDDAISSFGEGLKKNLKLVVYIIGANLVLATLFKNGATSNFAATIIDYLMNLSEKFSSLILSVTTVISSFFYNNFSTLAGTLYTKTVILTGATVELRFLASLIIQTLYGLVMLIAPTSVLLIAGLSYFEISYKDWFKNIWKLLLQLFIVVVLIIVIVTIFSM